MHYRRDVHWLLQKTHAALFAGYVATSLAALAGDPFAENVRTTEPVSAAEQVKSFHLPPGFEIDLVASEPQIAKPMNMAFDSQGRLWLTTSLEYPFPKKPGEPARDSIKVFEDTDHDGKYDKVTTFAEGLDIPIAILPYGDGCLAWSIPNITYFRDTDGDGKADRREVIFGPLGWERDTHGNIASFRRGNDGWIYGTHGFNNNSTFKAKDGSTISLNSGNTYRFRPDGSRVEQYTWGQVNPFGMCVDEHGYLYTADCHSSPIYQLIPEGYYPSFGKPDDGLGFAPTTIQHSHGSTAIAGIVMVPEEGWPADLRGHLFIGNVMTSRINHDRLEWRGSTPVGHEMPDFLSTDDPWFRPVDIQIGPDGALYIADFYNRIIGHYEVPLTHPGRDRLRGRIWRIRYTGPASTPSVLPNLRQANPKELFASLGSANLTLRSLALNELTDRVGASAATTARQLLSDTSARPAQRAGALWLLARLEKLDAELLRTASTDPSSLARTHVARAVAALTSPTSATLHQLHRALQDPDPHVVRAAAEALAKHPSLEHIQPLLIALDRAPETDTHLRHTLKIAVRDQFRIAGAFAAFHRLSERDRFWGLLSEIALAVPSAEAADFLVEHRQKLPEAPGLTARVLKHAARFGSASQTSSLISLAQNAFAQDYHQQLEFLQALRQGFSERGQPMPSSMREWSTDLATKLLQTVKQSSDSWRHIPIAGNSSENPWIFQERRTADGRPVQLLSSLAPGGEAMTGILRSQPFALPASISFLIAGHDGYPDKPAKHKNRVLLRETGTGAVLAEAAPPRSDVAQPVRWDLRDHQGKQARIEIVDEDTGDAYAWLAAGLFEPKVAPWPQIAPRDLIQQITAATELAESGDLARLSPALLELAQDPASELQIATSAARALSSASKADGLAALGQLANEKLLGSELRRELCKPIAQGDLAGCNDRLVEGLRQSPWRTQVKIAETLAGHPRLAEQLLRWMEQSKASPQLLKEPSVGPKLSASLGDANPRVAAILATLPPTDESVQKLIDQRRTGFQRSAADPVQGAALFTKNCAVCHRIEGAGNLVGPQLDGIGNRGVDRLCEDILDPNRNVDQAFRQQLLITQDGEVMSGLFRREEGDNLVYANATGAEFSLPKKQIKERRDSVTSLMPGNFGELLTTSDFNHLLAYLVDQAERNRQK